MPYEILLQHASIVSCLCVFGIYKKLESGKREFVANLPIKNENLIQENPLDRFANSCHNICMQQQIYNLTEAIEQTYRVVERIEQGQKDDRIGTLQAGRKHIILAMNQPPEDRAAAMELGRANMLCAQSQIFETFKRRVRAYEPIPDSMFLRIAREFRHSGYLSRRDKEFDEIQEYYDLYLLRKLHKYSRNQSTLWAGFLLPKNKHNLLQCKLAYGYTLQKPYESKLQNR